MYCRRTRPQATAIAERLQRQQKLEEEKNALRRFACISIEEQTREKQ
jgi:hypothetical protein